MRDLSKRSVWIDTVFGDAREDIVFEALFLAKTTGRIVRYKWNGYIVTIAPDFNAELALRVHNESADYSVGTCEPPPDSGGGAS